jgi:phosphoribosylaminoimidazolecarboxamide formyltransferase/IMP cyclohydrolase
MTRALISVSDKTGLLELAKALQHHHIHIISTGGTARYLTDHGIVCEAVSDITHFPEMMEGRVKTLHPAIHGGILARRGIDDATLLEHHIPFIDFVIVNLYPFHQTIQSPNATLTTAIENIDVGGPAMIRAAAKNHAFVTVVVDPTDYSLLIEALPQVPDTLKQTFAAKAFSHTATYDATIAGYLADHYQTPLFPAELALPFQKCASLRYGENPHQQACLYQDKRPVTPCLPMATQHQGLPLSYNNIADGDAALQCLLAFQTPACVIVKHANPCGVALGQDALEAYQKAFSADPTSAFGGIVALNTPLDESLVRFILKNQFVEILLAPSFTQAALEAAHLKPNVRLLSFGTPYRSHVQLDYKRILGGLLVQTEDTDVALTFQTVTQREPTSAEFKEAHFAWQVCRFVKSNAIVIANHHQTLGIGAGQMSRVMSVRIACLQAQENGFSVEGATLASDAFFPFPDNIEKMHEAGITCVVQPGGSKKDADVIEAANQRGIAMIFTGMRHFKH